MKANLKSEVNQNFVSDYHKQLNKYASDLVNIYQSEKERRSELENANKQILQYAEELNITINNLKAAHSELQESYLDTIHRLVLAAEFKDENTSEHLIRISKYCELLAQKMGLPKERVEKITYAAPMHDIGKIGIPDSILNKPGKLTEEEFEVIKTHTTIGANILNNSKSEILQTAKKIAVSHHEKWNGEGYPYGLKGQNIPVEGRIVAIADVFDALTTERPYKKAFSIEITCNIIREKRGEHFDPEITDIFFENLDELLEIKKFVDKKRKK